MELDSRAHVYITYLSLALKVSFPSLASLPSKTTLKGYDEKLQAIEKRLGLGRTNPMIEVTANDLSHRAAVAYGFYTGRCPQLIRITVDVALSEILMARSPSPPKSPMEERAFHGQIEVITMDTRSNGRRLPDIMPVDITWEYLSAWETALNCSPPPSPLMCNTKGWAILPSNANHANWVQSPTSTEFADSDGVSTSTPQDSDSGLG